MKLIFSCIFFILVLSTYAQKEELSLDKIVNVYSFNSPQVILAKILFENSRLDYENYKKTFCHYHIPHHHIFNKFTI